MREACLAPHLFGGATLQTCRLLAVKLLELSPIAYTLFLHAPHEGAGFLQGPAAAIVIRTNTGAEARLQGFKDNNQAVCKEWRRLADNTVGCC